ncbi:Calpain small subunit 1 [Lamellibrachia satsuma]|nr:Calpain small subunit 1 [Lamellibrachia satsuma]
MLVSEFKFEGFAEDTCRGMVAMMDVDQSGKLGYDEFRILWSGVKLWKTVFKKFDKDQSGTFNSYELRQALRATGFTVSNATFNTLVMRYSHKDGTMYFDDYLRCVIRMKTMFAIFADMKMPSGKAEFSLDQFIQTTMYS